MSLALPSSDLRPEDQLSAPQPQDASPSATAVESSEPKPGRDARGRFAPGNPGGRGNPFGRKVAALKTALLDSVGAAELVGIIRLFVGKAADGDTAAAKLLFQYVLGQPSKAPDPDALDQAEWQQYLTCPATAELLDKLLATMPHAAALAVLRAAWPAYVRFGLGKKPVQAPSENAAASAGAEAGPSTNGTQLDRQPTAPTTNGTPEAVPPPYPVANPYARRVAALRCAVLEAVTNEDMARIGQALQVKALDGHMPSAKLLFQHVLGKPPRGGDPDALDCEEWRLLSARPATPQSVQKLLESLPHHVACAQIHAAHARVPEQLTERLASTS